MQNINPAGQGNNSQPASNNIQNVIRLRISLQYGEKGSINYLLTPESADHWEQVLPQDCRTTMRRLFEAPVTAYQLGNYAQLRGLVYTHIVPNPVDFRGGFVQINLFVDRRYQLPAKTIIATLAKTEQLLFANQDKFRASIEGTDYGYKQTVETGVASLLAELTKQLRPSMCLVAPKPAPANNATAYRVVTSQQQLEEVFCFPDQPVFNVHPLITIVESTPNAASPTRHNFIPYDRTGTCVEVRDHIVKVFEIISATNGKIYGAVREGTQATINLQGMAGFLPRTLNVNPQAKAVEYTLVGTQIVVDEKKVRFYKEFTLNVVEEGTMRPISNAVVEVNGQKLRTNATGVFVGQFWANEQEKNIRISTPNHEPHETVLRLAQLPPTEKCSSQVVLKPRQNALEVSISISGEVFPVKNLNLPVTSPVYSALSSGFYKGYPVGKLGENQFQIRIPSQMNVAGNSIGTQQSFFQKYWMVIAAFIAGALLAATIFFALGPSGTEGTKNEGTPENPADAELIYPTGDEGFNDAEGMTEEERSEEEEKAQEQQLMSEDQEYLKANDIWDIQKLKSDYYQNFLRDICELKNIDEFMANYDSPLITDPKNINSKWVEIFELMKGKNTNYRMMRQVFKAIRPNNVEKPFNVAGILQKMKEKNKSLEQHDAGSGAVGQKEKTTPGAVNGGASGSFGTPEPSFPGGRR